MRFIYPVIVFAILATTAFVLPAQAENALSRGDVEKIIKEYLADNPEVIIESLENYREKQERSFQANAEENIKKNLDYLTRASAPSFGNPDADIVVVEFFDYNCGYCRRAWTDIQKLAEEDGNVRFIFKEMPILSPNSVELAKWSLAAHKQDKYFEFHSAVMMHKGTKSAGAMKKIASELGLDPEQLEKDAGSSQIQEELDKSLSVAREIGIRGTPAFIINGELYPGYLGEEGLRQSIEKARENSDKKEG